MGRQKLTDLEIKKITEKLKKALENSHLSISDLANETKIPIATLRSYMSGSRCPSYENAVKISECFGVGVGAFLSSEQKKQLNKSKGEIFMMKNSSYVALIRSLGYDVDTFLDGELNINCRISTKTKVYCEFDKMKWSDFRRGIDFAVKKIVDECIVEAIKEQKAKQKDDTISDLLKTLTAVNAVISSGSVDGETLEALHQLTDKYKL
jgi:transcriptional regulator with XRE-family HTH domain